jgi:hypothetical protein
MKEVARAALVLIFLAFSLNFSVSATHASSPASADASLGRRLADLLDPVELLVTMNRRLFRQRLEMNSQNGQLQVLRDKSPQVFAAMESSGEDGIEEGVRKNYDDRQKRIANLFNESLSVSDLENLVSYYESPLGKKVVALGFAHMNVSGSQEPGRPTSSNNTFDKMAVTAHPLIFAILDGVRRGACKPVDRGLWS